MNYMKISKYDAANGPGLRNILWTAGCRFHCKNCHNKEAWPLDAGKKYTNEVYNELVSDFRNPSMSYILAGISILGGEPLLEESRETILDVVKKFKAEFPDKTIWMWTGYLFENISNLEILQYIDVIVDGLFVQDLYDIDLKYRGSSNQRIIDVKLSLKNNKTELLKL